MDKPYIPVIPPLPDDLDDLDPGPCDPNPVVAICGECGLVLHRVMGFVCGNGRCPVFPRVTC